MIIQHTSALRAITVRRHLEENSNYNALWSMVTFSCSDAGEGRLTELIFPLTRTDQVFAKWRCGEINSQSNGAEREGVKCDKQGHG